MVLVGEEGVRPARRGDQRHAPGAFAQRARGGRAHLHAALGRRRGWIEIRLGERLGQAGAKALLGDHPAPVAVHLEGHDRIREAHAIVVEVEDGVEEGVGETLMMERRVGVGHVHALLEQPPREKLARFAVTPKAHRRVLRLAPDIVPGIALSMPGLDLVVGEHAERRDDVGGEVLVLIVAPDHDHVGTELVEELPGVAEVAQQAGAVAGRRGGTAIAGVLAAHGLGPAGGVPVALRQSGVLHDRAEDVGHVLVMADEGRVMGHAQAENLAHVVPPGSPERPACECLGRC
jgi:hypothetical protein